MTAAEKQNQHFVSVWATIYPEFFTMPTFKIRAIWENKLEYSRGF